MEMCSSCMFIMKGFVWRLVLNQWEAQGNSEWLIRLRICLPDGNKCKSTYTFYWLISLFTNFILWSVFISHSSWILNPHPINIFNIRIILTGVQLDPITKYARKRTQHHFYGLCLALFKCALLFSQQATWHIDVPITICFYFFPHNIHCSFLFFQSCSVTISLSFRKLMLINLPM